MSAAKRQRLSIDRQQNEETKPSLETFPIIILDQIFELVQSPDLVNVALVSKELYWPAVNRIYKNLTIYEDDIIDGETEMFDPSNKTEWQINYGTVFRLCHLKSLAGTLKRNKKLADLVNKVSLKCACVSDEVAEFLKLVPKLKSFHDDDGTLPERSIPDVEILACPGGHLPNLSPRLVELKLRDFDDGTNWVLDFARDLIALKGYINLRKLQFADYDCRDYPAGVFDGFENFPLWPNWIDFMHEIVKQGVKLDLKYLGLCGDIQKEKARAIENLRKGIHLENLNSLVLCCRDCIDPESGTESFTEMITKNTPNIESLEIYAMDRKNVMFVQAIDRSLRQHIPNQLKELSILYCPDRNSEFEHGYERIAILDAIVSSQRNLVKLKVDDRFWLHQHPDTLFYFEDDEAINEAMENPSPSEPERSKLFPRIMDSPHRRPHISLKNSGILSEFLDVIYRSLRLDPIYIAVPKKMRALEQYCYGRMFIDTKKHGLFVNGKTKRFARDRAWDEGSDVSFGYPNSDYLREQLDLP